LALVVLAATIFDIYIQQLEISESQNGLTDTNNSDGNNKNAEQIKHEPILPLQILLSFSALTNLKKLFTVNKSSDQLDCLHAIRFLSMGWYECLKMIN
jgi:hypothetical protein